MESDDDVAKTNAAKLRNALKTMRENTATTVFNTAVDLLFMYNPHLTEIKEEILNIVRGR